MQKIPVPYIVEIITFLMAAVTIAPLFKRMKLSPALGYLFAGAVIGPYAMGLVQDIESVQNVAELGVIFLMFIIGLELPLERLVVMRRYVFGLGLSQVLFTSMMLAGIAIFLGFPVTTSVVIGGALSLSSTALVIQLLSERHELSTKYGRSSFSILLFQDLAVVPLLAVTLLLSDRSSDTSAIMTLLTAFLKGGAAIIMIFIVGRFVLRPMYQYFASVNDDEIFTAATLLIILGVSWATGYAGLSMALGAFLAGMLIAETEYRHQVEADIRPFQGLLLGLFFIGIGMSIDFRMIAEQAGLIVILVFSLMLVKAAMLFMLCRAFNMDRASSLRTAAMLSQGGEFAFVVIKLAMVGALVNETVGQTILVVVAISMALTPLFATIAAKLTAHNVFSADVSVALDHLAEDTHGMKNHVIIAGFGRVGKTVASVLEKNNVQYIALDLDVRQVSDACGQGLPVYYGNASKEDILEAVGGDRAAVIVIALDSPNFVRKVAHTAHSMFPAMQILARATDAADKTELEQHGVNTAIADNPNIGIQLGQQTVAAWREKVIGGTAPANQESDDF